MDLCLVLFYQRLQGPHKSILTVSGFYESRDDGTSPLSRDLMRLNKCMLCSTL